MNTLIFTAENAQMLLGRQSGQNQLAPVELSDGRYFLMSDVLDEKVFKDTLDGIDYVVTSWDETKLLVKQPNLDI